ncbi:MAG: hypothetical protein HC876_18215, partial [Chloroflexaceae bacterium]|nr:hypothetical protein [Chloroflexaceae bacterium]
DTRIRPSVTAGTLLVAQADATYDGLDQELLSNIVTVLVVDASQQALATAAAVGTATAQRAATSTPTRSTGLAGGLTNLLPSPTSTFAVSGAAGGASSAQNTAVPSATSTAAVPGGATPQPDLPNTSASLLPNTSTGMSEVSLGVSLSGWMLLLFVVVRRVRVYRASRRV